MNAFRVARGAARVSPSVTTKGIQRRGYAEAVSDKIKLSLALPHQVGRPIVPHIGFLPFSILEAELGVVIVSV